MIIQQVLSEEEKSTLIRAMGMATGLAMKDGHSELAKSIVSLTTKLMHNDPDFVPYTTDWMREPWVEH